MGCASAHGCMSRPEFFNRPILTSFLLVFIRVHSWLERTDTA